MKNTVKIFSILMMLLLCTALLASCGDALSVKDVEADPYGVIMAASEKQADALAERLGGIDDALETVTAGIATYEVKVELPEDSDTSVGEISAEFVVDPENGAYSGEAGVGVKGALVTGEIWGDKDQFVLSVPMLLGDGAYGVRFDTLMEDLENSTTLAAFGLSWDKLKAQLGLDLESILDKAGDKDVKAAAEQYKAEAEAVMKAMTPDVAEEKVGKTKVITVTYTFTRDDFVKYGRALDAYLKAMLGDLMDMAEVDMDLENMPETATYKYYLDKKTGDLCKIDMDMGDEMKGTVTYSTDAAKPLDMTFDVTAPIEDGTTSNVKGSLGEVTEGDRCGFVLVADTTVDGESETVTLTFLRSADSGEYELKMGMKNSLEGEMVMSGVLTCSDTEARFTVDKISVPGEDTNMGKVTMSVRAGGTVEAVPEYKNILKLATADLLAILVNLQ